MVSARLKWYSVRLERHEKTEVKMRPQSEVAGGQSIDVQYSVARVTHLIIPATIVVIGIHEIKSYTYIRQ